jgi:titin
VHPNIEYDKKFAEPQSIKATKMFNIPVKIIGIPRPKVTWSVNEKPVEPSDRLTLEAKDTHYGITLKNLTRKDAGVYTVSAENVVGRKHAEFELKVLGECFEMCVQLLTAELTSV